MLIQVSIQLHFVLIVIQMIIDKRNGNSFEVYAIFDELLYKTRFIIERTNAC